MNKLTRDGKLVITVKAGMWSPLGDHPGLGVPVQGRQHMCMGRGVGAGPRFAIQSGGLTWPR